MDKMRILSPQDFLEFNSELQGLVRAGVPLPEGLERLCMELKQGRLKTAVDRVHKALTQGEKLSDAARVTNGAFSEYYISLLRAGEAAGSLDNVLLQATREAKSRIRFSQSLRLVTLYPLVMAFSCLLVVIFILVFLVPKISSMFMDLGAMLPSSTLFFLRLSDIFRYQTWIPVSIAAVLIVLWWILNNTPRGRYIRDLALVSFPGTQRLVVSCPATVWLR